MILVSSPVQLSEIWSSTGLCLDNFGVRGFQKGITLGGRTSGRINLVGLQKWVAKKFAKFLHLIWDLSWGS